MEVKIGGAQYVKYFPRGKRYVSLLRDAEDPEGEARLETERACLRAMVRRQVADLAIVTQPDEGVGASRGLLGPMVPTPPLAPHVIALQYPSSVPTSPAVTPAAPPLRYPPAWPPHALYRPVVACQENSSSPFSSPVRDCVVLAGLGSTVLVAVGTSISAHLPPCVCVHAREQRQVSLAELGEREWRRKKCAPIREVNTCMYVHIIHVYTHNSCTSHTYVYI